jgi:transcriptional regulator with XRE-family HTH domain
MGRKRSDTPSTAPAWDWYLNDWLRTLDKSQTELAKAAGWSKTAASDICTGKTGYSKRLVNEAAYALNISTYELLMHPDEAMTIRRLIVEGGKIADLGKRLKVVSDRTGTDG